MATSFYPLFRWTILLGLLSQAILALDTTSSGVPNSSHALPKTKPQTTSTSEAMSQPLAQSSTDTPIVATSALLTTSHTIHASTPSSKLQAENTSQVTSSNVISPSPEVKVKIVGDTNSTLTYQEPEDKETNQVPEVTNHRPEVEHQTESVTETTQEPKTTTSLPDVTSSATTETREVPKTNQNVESTSLILNAQLTSSVPVFVSSTAESVLVSVNERSFGNGTSDSGLGEVKTTTQTLTRLPDVSPEISEENVTIGHNISYDASLVVLEDIKTSNAAADLNDSSTSMRVSNTNGSRRIEGVTSTVIVPTDRVSALSTSTRNNMVLPDSTVLDSTTSSTVPSLIKNNTDSIENVSTTKESNAPVNESLADDVDVNLKSSSYNETDDVVVYTETNVSDKAVANTTKYVITLEEPKNESNIDPFVVIVESLNSDLISPFSKIEDNSTINQNANVTVETVRKDNSSSDSSTVIQIMNKTPGQIAEAASTPPNPNTSNDTQSNFQPPVNNTNHPENSSSTDTTADILRPKLAPHVQTQTQEPRETQTMNGNPTMKEISEETIKRQQIPLASGERRPSVAANFSTEEARTASSTTESLSTSSIFVTDGTSPSPITPSTVASSTEYINGSDTEPKEEEMEYRVTGIIKIIEGATWNSRLTDLRSSDFRLLAANLKDQLNILYQGDDVGEHLKEIEINSFSDNEGSILVMYSLVFTSKVDWLDSKKLKHVVTQGLRNGHLGTFKLDVEYTNFRTPWSNPHNPLEMGTGDPPIPQWAIAVIVVAAACLIFSLLFAAVTVYGRGQGSPHRSLYDNEGMLDSPCPEWERKMAAAYENMAADNISETDMPKRRSFHDEPLCRPLERSNSTRSNSSIRRNPESTYALNS